ncbi:MAG: hypothetical protein AAGI68_09845 [Planctomycetota bacterium]
MVGWLYIDGAVVAPLHRFKHDHQAGVIRFDCSAKLLVDRTLLRGEVAIETYNGTARQRVRCLTARRMERVYSIEAVELGPIPGNDRKADPGDDYLIVDGRKVCALEDVWLGDEQPERGVRSVALGIPSRVWRIERGTRDGLLARLPDPSYSPLQAVSGVQDLTPPLLTESLTDDERPAIEVVRLGQRQRLRVELFAADWQPDMALVLGHVTQTTPIGRRVEPVTVAAAAVTAC